MLQPRLKTDSHTQEEVLFGYRMIFCVPSQDFVHIALEPLLRGRQVLNIIIHRRLDTQERGLVVSLDVERVSSVDVVPAPNREIRSVFTGEFTHGSNFEEYQL